MAEVQQPVSQVADGSLPDADGWYKSSVEVSTSEVDASEENASEYPHMKTSRVQLEKVARDWPEGKLFRMSYGGAETIQDALSISYGYELKDQGFMGTLQIDLYIGLSDVDAAYDEVKTYLAGRDKESSPDAEWKEWPAGFPDQNDYEQVSHCGANSDVSCVVWTQNQTLIKLSKMQVNESMLAMFPAEERAKVVSPNLQEYADGIWQAVYGMGL